MINNKVVSCDDALLFIDKAQSKGMSDFNISKCIKVNCNNTITSLTNIWNLSNSTRLQVA